MLILLFSGLCFFGLGDCEKIIYDGTNKDAVLNQHLPTIIGIYTLMIVGGIAIYRYYQWGQNALRREGRIK